MKESEIQSSIIDYLEIQEASGRLTYQRTNNGGVFDPTTKGFRRSPKGIKKGYPDIIVLKRGKMIGIEVKSSTGRQSAEQKDIQDKFLKHGADYFVVRSLEDVLEIL